MTVRDSITLVIASAVFYYASHQAGWLDGTPFSLQPRVSIDFASLPSSFKEDDLHSSFPELEWDCYDDCNLYPPSHPYEFPSHVLPGPMVWQSPSPMTLPQSQPDTFPPAPVPIE